MDDENKEGCSYSVCLQDNPALRCDRKVTQQNKNTTQSPWMCREATARVSYTITEHSFPVDEEANTLNLRSSDPSILQCSNYYIYYIFLPENKLNFIFNLILIINLI